MPMEFDIELAVPTSFCIILWSVIIGLLSNLSLQYKNGIKNI